MCDYIQHPHATVTQHEELTATVAATTVYETVHPVVTESVTETVTVKGWGYKAKNGEARAGRFARDFVPQGL